MTQSNQDFKAQQFQSDANDLNQKALGLLKDAAVLAQHQELTELILIATSDDEGIGQVLTDSPVEVALKLLTMATVMAEQLGFLLTLDPENLAHLKMESKKLQRALAKLN